VEITRYHVVSRLFFLSFVIYYFYLQHQIRHLSTRSILGEIELIDVLLHGRTPILIGVCGVVFTSFVVLALGRSGLLAYLTNGLEIDWKFILIGAGYFLVRVVRDVVVTILFSLNKIKVIYVFYFCEIVCAVFLMCYFVPTYGGYAIYSSYIGASVVALVLFNFSSVFLYFDKNRKHSK